MDSRKRIKMVVAVNSFTTGWVTYYRHAQCKRTLAALDGWLRRKLRCVRLKHCKRVKAIADFLQANGVPQWRAWLLALSGKGWWRMAGSPQASEAMTIAWFDKLGLIRLTLHRHVVHRPSDQLPHGMLPFRLPRGYGQF